jgi:hypothetical protein
MVVLFQGIVPKSSLSISSPGRLPDDPSIYCNSMDMPFCKTRRFQVNSNMGMLAVQRNRTLLYTFSACFNLTISSFQE